MQFDVGSLPNQAAFGAVVTGLSPDDLSDAATRRALHELWLDRGLVIFRSMQGLDTHLRLSEIFGELEEHPLLRGVERAREHKFIIDIADGIDVRPDGTIDPQSEESDVYEIDGELRAAYLPWHLDLVYVDEINHGGVLRAVTLPRNGGQTGFIDRIAAYNSLPPELAQRIENLSVLYHYVVDSSKAKFGKKPDRCVKLRKKMLMAAEHRSVKSRSIHPMVYRQANTGRKVLNVSPWFAEGIEGMENEVGDALLAEVIKCCIDERGAYYHSYEMGDMVAWDNWRMLHCAVGMPAGERRHMRRTTIAGDYGLGRYEQASVTVGGEAHANV